MDVDKDVYIRLKGRSSYRMGGPSGLFYRPENMLDLGESCIYYVN
jgi:hypothetical protein